MFFNTIWSSNKEATPFDRDVLAGTLKYLSFPFTEEWSGAGEYSVVNFPELEEVFVPSVTSIMDKNTFKDCPKLKRIVVAMDKKDAKTWAKYAPWGAPQDCEVVWDKTAKPKGSAFVASPVIVPKTTSTPTPHNYRHAMRELIEDIRRYTVARNYPDFQIINNGGVAIFTEDLDHGWTVDDTRKLGEVVDAVTVEDVNYGADINWDAADDEETPAEYREDFYKYMATAESVGVRSLVIDYCWSPEKIKHSFEECKRRGFGDCVATDRELTKIPTYELPHTPRDVYKIADLDSFMLLLNPNSDKDPQFKDKADYVTKLSETWFDCIIIDLVAFGEVMTREEIQRLRYKPNGARRLVCCYMSLGEAEVYRTYWNPEWSNYKPGSDDPTDPNYMKWKDAVSYCEWIAEPNPFWEGNYKVKYWTDEWKKVLFGTDDSYLDLILRANFDGVFLDVIDAYEYFESGEDGKFA